MGCSKSSPKKEVYSNTILPKEVRKTQNRQPKFITGKNLQLEKFITGKSLQLEKFITGKRTTKHQN